MPIQKHTASFFDVNGDEIEDLRLTSENVPFTELNGIHGENAHHVQALDALAQIAYCAQTEPAQFLKDFQNIHEVEVFDQRVTLPEIKAVAEYGNGKYVDYLTVGQRLALDHFADDMFGPAGPSDDLDHN